ADRARPRGRTCRRARLRRGRRAPRAGGWPSIAWPHGCTSGTRYSEVMRYFICPNCGTRALDDDGRAGLTHQPVGCAKCGFGYLFEILEDYYPPAGAGMVTCDRDARVLSCGRGVFELTGYSEREVLGKPLREAFGLSEFNGGDDP